MSVRLEYIEVVIPMLMSILALVFFTPKTRRLSYGIVTTAIAAEVLTPSINTVAFVACLACFAGLLFFDHLRVNSPRYQLSQRYD